MLCYKDTTFCTAECTDTECRRHKIHVPEDTFGFPVAYCDFSAHCPRFADAEQPQTAEADNRGSYE